MIDAPELSMMLGAMDKEDGLEGDGGNPDQSSKVNAVVAFFGWGYRHRSHLEEITRP